jgi:hypothetical protein
MANKDYFGAPPNARATPQVIREQFPSDVVDGMLESGNRKPLCHSEMILPE